jgi:hypothetical protein
LNGGASLPQGRNKMQLLAAIWIPAAAAAVVGLIGLYFAKLERREAEQRLACVKPGPGIPDESEDRPRNLLPRKAKPQPS